MANQYAIEKVYNNIDLLIQKCSVDGLMVLVSADQIFDVTKKLLPANIPLFIEKPAGLIPNETKTLAILADKFGTKNMVGYNRRYYSIFHKGIEIINEYGNLLGVTVEGHERFWKTDNIGFSQMILDNWIFANSTHTIDLLRFFGGDVNQIKTMKKSLKEQKGDQFVASIEFESGALGTYTSHWYSPGGWSVTLYSEGITVRFKPLEKGVWIDNDFQDREIITDDLDKQFKPGFYRQMEAFINMVKTNQLDWPGIDLNNALKTMELAERFANA